MNAAEFKKMIMNTLLPRSALFSSMLDMEGRDLNRECGYPDIIQPADYREMYDREGVARRIVACLPSESWPMDPDIYETEDPSETEFEKELTALVDKFNLFHYLQRIDILSGIGRFGLLLLGIDDGKSLREPAEGVDAGGRKAGNAKHFLLYLRAFDESVVTVVSTEQDIANPRYGLPTAYNIAFQDEGMSTGITEQVHWTRVIHVADGREMSEVYGTPRLQSVFNRLLDMRKILSGSGEMFWRGAFPGFSFEVNPEIAEQGVDLDPADMREEFEKYANGLQRYLALTGVSAKSLSPQVSDPTGHLEANLKNIAIALGIPFRILFGSEQAQLASGQDVRTWAKRIEYRQTKYLEPMLIRPFIDRLIAFGVLPEPKEYIIEWPDLINYTDEDKARVAAVRTTALAQYVQGGVDQLIPPRPYLLTVVGMTQEEVDAIMEEAEQYQGEQEEEQQQALGGQMQQGGAIVPEQEEQPPNKLVPASDGGQPEQSSFPVSNFDPNEPRDEDGKWTDEGAGSGATVPKEGEVASIDAGAGMPGPGSSPDPTLKPKWIPSVDRNELRIKFHRLGAGLTILDKREKISLKKVDAVGQEMTRVINEFPGLRDPDVSPVPTKLTMVAKGRLRLDGGGVAGDYDKRTGEIRLDSGQRLSAGRAPKIGAWTTDSSLEGNIRHEMGHAIASKYTSFGRRVEDKRFTLRDVLGRFHRMDEKVRGSVSRYARTDAEEAFCEAFSAYTSPNYQRGSMRVEIESLFDKALRK